MTKHESYDDNGKVDSIRLDGFNSPGAFTFRKRGLGTLIEVFVPDAPVILLGEHEIGALRDLFYQAEREIENARREAAVKA